MNIYQILESLRRVEQSEENKVPDVKTAPDAKTAPLPDHIQRQIVANPAMRADILAAYKRSQGLSKESADAKQMPGDQVRGTEPADNKKSGAHPFAGRLVGADESINAIEENLKKWFKEKWVRFGPDGKIRGDCARGSSSEGKPKCLPRAKANALGKKGRASAGARKRKQDPDANRSGKAKNVATKANESLRRGEYYIATVTLDTGEVKRFKVTSDEGYDDAIKQFYARQGRKVINIDMDFDIQGPVREQTQPGQSIPAKSIIQGYTVFYNPATGVVSVTRGGTDADAAIEQERISKPTMLAFNSAVYRMIARIEDETENLGEACWKGYHKEGMKTMFGKRYPNCVKNKSKNESSLTELDPGKGTYGPYQIYIGSYATGKSFSTESEALDEIKFLMQADPKSANDEWKIKDALSKTVWAHDPGAAVDDARRQQRQPIQLNKKPPGSAVAEATGDGKFDAMMSKIAQDPWTRLNADPNWEYEIEDLVARQIEPWLLAMEKSGMPITRDEDTLNPGWRKRYEQVANQLAQKYLTSKGMNPRDPDLLGKIRYAIDWHTDESKNVHGQLSAYSELPMQRYASAFDADGMTANMRDAMVGFIPNPDGDDDDEPPIRPMPDNDPRRLDPGNMEEAVDEKGALKSAQAAAKFIIRNLDDRAALKDYSMHFWSPEKFYQGATMAMRGAGFDEIVKQITQDRPAQFESGVAEGLIYSGDTWQDVLYRINVLNDIFGDQKDLAASFEPASQPEWGPFRDRILRSRTVLDTYAKVKQLANMNVPLTDVEIEMLDDVAWDGGGGPVEPAGHWGERDYDWLEDLYAQQFAVVQHLLDQKAQSRNQNKTKSGQTVHEQGVSEGIPFDQCPKCGGNIVHESMLNEKQDACYHKVKSRYKVWPSAYASGALVQCRKKGAANWGTGAKKESVSEEWESFVAEYGMTTGGTATGDAQTDPAAKAKQTAQVQQGVNKLKSAGVNIPSGSQAVQSLMKDPVKDPISQMDRTIDSGLGQEVQNVLTKGDSSEVNQLAALIKRVNQRSGA